MRVDEISSIKIKLASPEEILSWSYGEVTKPETINYRTQRPERGGLFCEVIFGPERDFQCYCGKYKRIRYKGIICDRCGVEVTHSSVRRKRLGHIKLACPVAHIWYLRGVPSRMGLVLNIPGPQLERVVYFSGYIVKEVDEKAKKEALKEIDKEYKEKLKNKVASPEELAKIRDEEKQKLLNLKPLKILSEIEYRELSLKYGHIFKAGTGAETLKEIFEKIDLQKEIEEMKKELKKKDGEGKKKIYLRLKLFEGMLREGIKPSWMFLEVIPVLPPELRPMVQLDGGRFASSDLNDLYRRVITRNNRLKRLLEISAPEVIVRNEKRMLQEAVDALIDNGMRRGATTKATTGGQRLLKSLADMLKGKQGRFRQNLLGKRVDYSGRSVIVVGPELRLYQCGLPKKMALELFKPFVAKELIERELAYNLRGALRLIEEEREEVWEALEKVVKGKLVLLNRAPTLHRLGIQAFEPVLIEGLAIRIHPLVCKAYNADFDGDQMAVHLPLSEEAQRETKERMLSTLNLLKPATGKPIVTPTQDIVIGCYWLTWIEEGAKGEGKVFSHFEEAILAREEGVVDLRAKIKVLVNPQAKGEERFIETTVGRILFNETLPPGFPFQNDLIDAKKLDGIVSSLIDEYPPEVVEETLDAIKKLGFEYATLSGISWSISDLTLPKEKPQIIESAEKETEKILEHFEQGLLSKEERRNKIIEVWTKAKSQIEERIHQILPKDSPAYMMVESGARGSWTQVIQMAGMKGLVTNPAGQVIELPVKNSYKEGLTVLEYFISTHGARKGTVDTALKTSTAGYLTRRLVDVAHEVIITTEDCGDEEGILISKKAAEEIGQNFIYKIVGRISLQDIKDKEGKIIVRKGEIIDFKRAKIIAHSENIKEVKVRSPLSCKNIRGLCQLCYGWDLGRNELIKLGEAVGIVAAQSIGEPGTQLTMRTFHVGGVAGGTDITLGLPRVEELFELRSPAKKAILSEVDGKVIDITKEKVIKIKAFNPEKLLEYKANIDSIVLVEKGDKVKKGQPLTDGSIDPKELHKIGIEKEKIAETILKEITKIYVSQGVNIHDKHFEVIIRQMFSRVRVIEEGDSRFIPGQVVERAEFLEEVERLKKLGKKNLPKAKDLFLGITKVALSTPSFLSAASFQETSRVLIRASLEGAEDKLLGLKENVILGKIIPAGTGFKKR